MVGLLCILQIIFTWPHSFQDALSICIGLLMQRGSALGHIERSIVVHRTRKVVDTAWEYSIAGCQEKQSLYCIVIGAHSPSTANLRIESGSYRNHLSYSNDNGCRRRIRNIFI